MKMITRVIRKCLGLLAAAVLLTAASLAQADVTVKAVSPRIGMLFADNEKVQVGAQVTGAVGATTVEYTVVETEGPYKTQGRITAGAEGAMLPLQLPGRGHYVLTLAANGARSTSTIAIVFPPAKPEAASPWGVCWTPPAMVGSPRR